MINVTNLLLGLMLLRRNNNTTTGGYGPATDASVRGGMPESSWGRQQPDADRMALIDALANRPSSAPYGSRPASMRPTTSGDPNVLNQWGGPTPRELDLYDPPPVRPLPFREQYRRDVPADATGRLTHDLEGRPLGARYVAGLREVDGPNVGLRPEEITDSARGLLGQEMTRSPRSRLGRSAGVTPFNDQNSGAYQH